MKDFCMRMARGYADGVCIVNDCWALLFDRDYWCGDYFVDDAFVWTCAAVVLAVVTPVTYLVVAPLTAVYHGFVRDEDEEEDEEWRR